MANRGEQWRQVRDRKNGAPQKPKKKKRQEHKRNVDRGNIDRQESKKSTPKRSESRSETKRPSGGTANHRLGNQRSGATKPASNAPKKTGSGAIGQTSTGGEQRRSGAIRAQSTVNKSVAESTQQRAETRAKLASGKKINAQGTWSKTETGTYGTPFKKAAAKNLTGSIYFAQNALSAVKEAGKQAAKDQADFEKKNGVKLTDEEKKAWNDDYLKQTAKMVVSKENREAIKKAAKEATKGIKGGTYTSEDLTAEEYQKGINALRMGGGNAKIANAAVGDELAKKFGSRTALSANKNAISRASHQFMQAMSYGDIENGLGKYGKAEKEALQESRESTAGMVGYGAGFMANMALGGVNSAGRSVAGAVLKGGAKSAGKKFAANRAGELVAETPMNIADALKMSKDENGNIDKKKFAGYLALNTGLTGAMGGAIEGIGMKLARKRGKEYIRLLEKEKSVGLTEEELAKKNKLKKQLDAARKDELAAKSVQAGEDYRKGAGLQEEIKMDGVVQAARDTMQKNAAKRAPYEEAVRKLDPNISDAELRAMSPEDMENYVNSIRKARSNRVGEYSEKVGAKNEQYIRDRETIKANQDIIDEYGDNPGISDEKIPDSAEPPKGLNPTEESAATTKNNVRERLAENGKGEREFQGEKPREYSPEEQKNIDDTVDRISNMVASGDRDGARKEAEKLVDDYAEISKYDYTPRDPEDIKRDKATLNEVKRRIFGITFNMPQGAAKTLDEFYESLGYSKKELGRKLKFAKNRKNTNTPLGGKGVKDPRRWGIDEYYPELSRDYPELFPPTDSYIEQFQNIAEVVLRKVDDIPRFEQPMPVDTKAVREGLVDDILADAEKNAGKYVDESEAAAKTGKDDNPAARIENLKEHRERVAENGGSKAYLDDLDQEIEELSAGLPKSKKATKTETAPKAETTAKAETATKTESAPKEPKAEPKAEAPKSETAPKAEQPEPKQTKAAEFKTSDDYTKFKDSKYPSKNLKSKVETAMDYDIDVSDRIKEWNDLGKDIAAARAKIGNSKTPEHIAQYKVDIEEAEILQTKIARSIYQDVASARVKQPGKPWSVKDIDATATKEIQSATKDIGGVETIANEMKSAAKPSPGSRKAQKLVAEEIKDFDSCLDKFVKNTSAKEMDMQNARASALLDSISEKLKADPNDAKAMSDLMKVVDKLGEDSTLPANVRGSAKKIAVATPKGRVGVALKAVEDLNKRYGERIDGVLKLTDDEQVKLATTEPGKELDDLYVDITKRLWNNIPATRMEKLNEVRHMFMLANIRTHARNVVGNQTFRLIRKISDDVFEVALQDKVFRKAIEARGGEVDRVRVKGSEIRENDDFLGKEFKEAYDESGSVSRYIETDRPDGVPVVKMKALNALIQGDYKALEKEDMWTFVPAFKKSYMQYVKSKGWKIAELTDAQKKMARDRALFDAEYATFRDTSAFSRWLTGKKHMFATKEGQTIFGTAMYRFINASMEGLIPFVKTPVNIFRRSIDYSPVSLFRALGEMSSKDPEVFKQGIHHLSTGLTGTGIFGLGYYLANTGMVSIDTQLGEHSGSSYYDMDMGYQDYSLEINVGGVHQSWSIDWMQPMQASLFMGAAARDMIDDMKEGKIEFGTNTIAALFGMTSPMLDASFMSGAKDAMEQFAENASKETAEGDTDLRGAFAKLILGDLPKNFVSGIVPQAVSQTANVTDKFQRDTRSTAKDPLAATWDRSLKQIANRIPGFRKLILNPKLDRWGDEKETGRNIAWRIFNAYVNPSNVKDITENKYDQELFKIRNSLEPGSKQYKDFFYKFTGNPSYDLADGKRMTYDQAYEYGKAKRKEQTMAIHHMMDSPTYSLMNDKMKQDEVKDLDNLGDMAGDYTLGVNYAIKAMKKSSWATAESDSKAYDRYVEASGGKKSEESNERFWKWRMDKERAITRSHSDGEDNYRLEGLFAIATGDDALVEAVHLKWQKEPELRTYWEEVKKASKGSGRTPRLLAFDELTDACCRIMSNVKNANLEDAGLGLKSAAAGKSANDGNKIPERVYRALGHFWNSAQAGGGLMLKYNKDGKYDLEKLDLYDRQLDKLIEKRPEGTKEKGVVMDYIENTLKVTDADEAACLYQTLYVKGNGNPGNKNHYKNPYKETIDDHLEWGENDDTEATSGSSGYGRRRGGRRGGRGGWGRGGGGGSATGSVPDTASGAIQGKITKVGPAGRASDVTFKSNINEAYRKKARRLREQSRKRA